MKRSLIAMIILLFSLSSVLGKSDNESFDIMLADILNESVPFIETDELAYFIDSLNGYYLLDIRTSDEYSISHIKGSVLVEFDSFNIDKINHIPKDSVVVVYCSVGYRSESIGEIMINNGYQNVYNLYGGIFKWVNEERVTFNTTGKTDSIHGYSKKWGRWLKNGDIVY